MEYKNLVKDFAQRTRKNLNLLRKLQQENPELEIFEVTQLVNSLLGLLVFPQQGFIRKIPEVSLTQLETEGWPIPRVVGEFPQVKNLNQLVRYLRNAIAHFNIKFDTDNQKDLTGLRVWNYNSKAKKKTWEAEISLAEIEDLVNRFIDLILDESFHK